MKCVLSALYSKDEFKDLHFYCKFCEKEIGYDEERECTDIPERCKCGNPLGMDDYSLSVCLKCDIKLRDNSPNQ